MGEGARLPHSPTPPFSHSLGTAVRGQVLARFARACDLLTDDGEVVALVWGGLAAGPLNIVLDREPGAALPAGTLFAVEHETLVFDDAGRADLVVDLAAAARWDARPDWAALACRRPHILANAQAVAALAAASGVRDPGLGPQRLTWAQLIEPPARDFLAAYRGGDERAFADAAGRLCGLGPGLTPAGDDWLTGWLLALCLAPEPPDASAGDTGRGAGTVRPSAARAGILAAAATGTTTLSRAFLICAADGEASADWHALLASVAGAPRPGAPDLAARVQAVLASGATSGAATLAGFLAGLDLPG